MRIRFLFCTVTSVGNGSSQVTVDNGGAGSLFHERTYNAIMKRRKRFQKETRQDSCNDVKSLSVRFVSREEGQDRNPVLVYSCYVSGATSSPKPTLRVRRGCGLFSLRGCCSGHTEVSHTLHCFAQWCQVKDTPHTRFSEEHVSFVQKRDVSSIQKRRYTNRTVAEQLRGKKILEKRHRCIKPLETYAVNEPTEIFFHLASMFD